MSWKSAIIVTLSAAGADLSKRVLFRCSTKILLVFLHKPALNPVIFTVPHLMFNKQFQKLLDIYVEHLETKDSFKGFECASQNFNASIIIHVIHSNQTFMPTFITFKTLAHKLLKQPSYMKHGCMPAFEEKKSLVT